MKKIYLELTADQKKRGVIFSSCLSYHKTDTSDTSGRIHEVMADDKEADRHIELLKNDSFFKHSPWKYNVIRQ